MMIFQKNKALKNMFLILKKEHLLTVTLIQLSQLTESFTKPHKKQNEW